MHIVETTFKPKRAKKEYHSVLLMQSYRVGKKVRKRTIANLSKCSPEEIAAFRLALANKNNLSKLPSLSDVSIQEGKSVGAVWTVYQVAKRLGIEKALGNTFEAKLAMRQIIARVIDQGSRLSSVRLHRAHGLADVLNLEQGFNENNLYDNLRWLSANQAKIEDKLFDFKYQKKSESNPGSKQKCELFLYDVTSSYLEGEKNELANYGYNRDGKKGKKQIVIGLLCGQDGQPVSVEVFTGNTQDSATFESQIKKTAKRFGCRRVTFVGDRGMIKSGQIDELEKVGFAYITAITKPQIETLLRENTVQMELFTRDLCQVEHEGIRYILKLNPTRKQETEQIRVQKQQAIAKLIAKENQYLTEHKRAKAATAIKRVNSKIEQLKIDKWVSVIRDGLDGHDEQDRKDEQNNQDKKSSKKLKESRKLAMQIDKDKLVEISRLDGCYVIKTNLLDKTVSKETIHDRYKDLTLVEQTFRTSKTTHLELRPVFVTKEESARAHVFVVMLSYLITKELEQAWKNLDVTVQEGIEQLKTLCSMQLRVQEKNKPAGACHKIPIPRKQSRELLKALNIKIPKVLPRRNVNVVSRKKLNDRK